MESSCRRCRSDKRRQLPKERLAHGTSSQDGIGQKRNARTVHWKTRNSELRRTFDKVFLLLAREEQSRVEMNNEAKGLEKLNLYGTSIVPFQAECIKDLTR